jgi:putative methionine-R-sulfoxide reductase with GAF domain
MDHLDQYVAPQQNISPMSQQAALGESEEPFPSAEVFLDPLRFPGEDGGRSLAEMAKRDLHAALQLLAERAQHVTGASGAAIALRQGEIIVCRASAGPSAPKVGESIEEVSSGLAGESVRTRQVLLCHDAASDPRVNGAICEARGVVSAMVMPLMREQEVVGVFELLSEKAHAFEERDIAALERLGEMIQTAVDHSEAANRAQREILQGEAIEPPNEAETALQPAPQPVSQIELAELPPPATSASPQAEAAAAPPPPVGRSNIGTCSACGFPVSQGRTLCLDCDNSQNPDVKSAAGSDSTSLFLSLNSAEAEKSWLQSHKYLIGTILVTAATVGIVLWFR